LIPSKDKNSYLKNIYKSPNAMDTIPNLPKKEGTFSMEGIESRVKRLANGKSKDIEGYQDQILKLRGPILIPHIPKLLNLAIKQGFFRP
jgi:hypothetical protein